jgi:hypothetical protein
MIYFLSNIIFISSNKYQRMEDDIMVKKLTNWKPFGKRPAGRPKNR